MYRTPAEIPRARLPLLDRVTVKTPCRASWDEMEGDDRVRFCTRCSKNVYDLSAMTQDEAETFLATHLDEEDPCVRLYRRPDGRILTSECCEGSRRRHATKTLAAGAAGLCAIAATTAALASANVRIASGHHLPRTRAQIDVKRLPVIPGPTMDDDVVKRGDQVVDVSGFAMGAIALVPETPPEDSHRFPPLPPIREIATDVKGALPQPVVRRILRQNLGRVRLCYENALARNPNLGGTVAVDFVIGPDGSVHSSRDAGSDLPDASVVQCIARGMMSASFPSPERGLVLVSYRVSLSPRT